MGESGVVNMLVIVVCMWCVLVCGVLLYQYTQKLCDNVMWWSVSVVYFTVSVFVFSAPGLELKLSQLFMMDTRSTTQKKRDTILPHHSSKG